LGVSALALFFVVRWAGWEPLLATLTQVDFTPLSYAVLLYFISMTARALAWRELLGGQVPLGRVLAALNQGYLLNNLLPWRMGEIGRGILLGRRPGMSVARVLASIFVERIFDVILAVTLLVGLFPWVVGATQTFQQALLVGLTITMAAALVWILLSKPAWIRSILARAPGGLERWGSTWERFEKGIAILRSSRRLVRSFLLLALSWALAGLEYWFALQAVIPEAELSWAYFMLTVTLLGVAIPSSPGYIGVFEAAGVLALSAFGVSRSSALAATLVIHALVYFLGSVWGMIALLEDGETLRGLYLEVQVWLRSGPREIHT
jgi:hypothetical protein